MGPRGRARARRRPPRTATTPSTQEEGDHRAPGTTGSAPSTPSPGIQVYEDPDPEGSPLGPYPIPSAYAGTCGVVAGGGPLAAPASPLTNDAGQIDLAPAASSGPGQWAGPPPRASSRRSPSCWGGRFAVPDARAGLRRRVQLADVRPRSRSQLRERARLHHAVPHHRAVDRAALGVPHARLVDRGARPWSTAWRTPVTGPALLRHPGRPERRGGRAALDVPGRRPEPRRLRPDRVDRVGGDGRRDRCRRVRRRRHALRARRRRRPRAGPAVPRPAADPAVRCQGRSRWRRRSRSSRPRRDPGEARRADRRRARRAQRPRRRAHRHRVEPPAPPARATGPSSRPGSSIPRAAPATARPTSGPTSSPAASGTGFGCASVWGSPGRRRRRAARVLRDRFVRDGRRRGRRGRLRRRPAHRARSSGASTRPA